MSKKTAPAELRELFADELKNDSNATLETALQHARDLYERGPEEPAVAQMSSRLAEIEELMTRHGPHTPLSDFV